MKIITIALSILFTLQIHAAEKVEFVANRIHSLFVFVSTISGDSHGSQEIKELFEKSQYNTDESKKQIVEFQDLDRTTGRFISFENLPTERKSAINIETLVLTQSAFAKDLEDLQTRTLGLLRHDEQVSLFQILHYFEPIHEQLLWKPYHAEMERVANEFQKKSRSANLDKMFGQVVKFYNSEWPSTQRFRISLFPIPPSSNHSTATSYGAFESVGIIVGKNDIEGNLGVIFHEICHTFYGAQNADFQNQISRWYLENKSPYAIPAYSWLNETLATILGNAWFYKIESGQEPPKSWYNQPTIDGFAKALYPEVRSYLDAHKEIDQKFINKSVEIFQKTFPEAIRELDRLLSHVIIFSDSFFGPTSRIARKLESLFFISKTKISSPISDTNSLSILREELIPTDFMIAHWGHIVQFDTLKANFPQLVKTINKADKGKNVFGLFEFSGRRIIVVVLKDGEDIDYLTRKLKQLKRIEKLNEFLDLDTI
jgi:hypothetical protein